MSDIAILKEMIKDSATVSVEERNNKNQVTLIEPQCNDYSVTIYGMPDDDEVIIIKADTFSSPDTVFFGKRGECRRADFLIIADTDKKQVILCIEMKGGKGGSEKESIQQLKGAQCFAAYCREIGQIFWEKPNFLANYAYRFVRIDRISIPKQKTRIDRYMSNHDSPERMLKISSPHHLQFNHLVGAIK